LILTTDLPFLISTSWYIMLGQRVQGLGMEVFHCLHCLAEFLYIAFL
jgi:hypothetical protein